MSTPHLLQSATKSTVLDVKLEPVDNRRLADLCGQLGDHLQQVEQRLGVQIDHRGHLFRISGGDRAVALAAAVIRELYAETAKGELSPKRVQSFLQESAMEVLMEAKTEQKAEVMTLRKKRVEARGANQQAYLAAIDRNDINFGIGPAGTGKTYLAVAKAVEGLEQDRVRRLILARPAVEAGERLGFLPGDLVQKVDPYLRPLYDALYEMLGFDHVSKLIERNVIEVAPLAFMRGRTLNEAFIILDEAQNTTVEQMKMLLTRIGFGSKVIVTGDITQTDLPSHQRSGLLHVLDVLQGVKGISFTFFDQKDVVRHPLIQSIVAAYEEYEKDRGQPS